MKIAFDLINVYCFIPVSTLLQYLDNMTGVKQFLKGKGVVEMGNGLKTISAHIQLWILKCCRSFTISRHVD